MKENYIISAFRETVKRDFAKQAAELNAAFDKRIQALRQENADATKEKQRHLEGQILPGIAAYETLCRCFCDSDDVSYENLHPQLVWHRTKTLGRGGDCCDFCFKIRGK